MTVYCEGHPVLVNIISRNHGVTLYNRGDVKVELTNKGYYVYNLYSNEPYRKQDIVKFHKKLKIHVCDSHGYYVICHGIRCYMNSLMSDTQMAEIGFYKAN